MLRHAVITINDKKNTDTVKIGDISTQTPKRGAITGAIPELKIVIRRFKESRSGNTEICFMRLGKNNISDRDSITALKINKIVLVLTMIIETAIISAMTDTDIVTRVSTCSKALLNSKPSKTISAEFTPKNNAIFHSERDTPVNLIGTSIRIPRCPKGTRRLIKEIGRFERSTAMSLTGGDLRGFKLV